jgi:hypothetical protein
MNQIQQLIKKYERERENLDYLIEKLKSEVSDTAPDDDVPRPRKQRRRSEHSVPTLAEKLLETVGKDGMTVPTLVSELRRMGAVIESEIPSNSVNSTLHKTAKRGTVPFVKDGLKWYLKKYAPQTMTAIVTPPSPLRVVAS